MRILTKKIHRAYPELDKFDDEVCKRYIKRALRLQNSWRFGLLLILVLPFSWGIWAVLMLLTRLLVDQRIFTNLPGLVQDGFIAVLFSGIAWMPLLATLLTRDRWLHRCLRKQLTGVQCPTCGYSLIGLTLLDDQDHPSVHCPECGHTTALKDMGLTQADIDPTLIQDSA